MTLVNTAEPHFIRCIKPNAEKVPNRFTSNLAMEQLLSSGVFEAVRIRQSGYASRIIFKDLLSRYRTILPKPFQATALAAKTEEEVLACVKAFLEQLPVALTTVGGLQPGSIVTGSTKVFAKAAAMNALERARELTITTYAVIMQRHFRGYRVRKKLSSVRTIFEKLNAWCRDNRFYTAPGCQHTALAKYKTMVKIEASVLEVSSLLSSASDLPMVYPRTDHVKKVKARMENEVSVLRQLQGMAKSVEPVEIEALLKRSKGLELEGSGDVVDALVSRVKRLKIQIPLINAMKKAMEQSDLAQLQEVMEKVRKEHLHTRPEEWIEELKGEVIAGEVYNLIEDLKAKKKLEDIERKRKEELQQNLQEQVKEHEAKFQEDEKERERKEEEAKKKRKATITGFTLEEQEKVKLELMAASHEFDAPSLERGLAMAAAQGMAEEDEVLVKAKELYENMQTEAFLEATLEEMTQNVQKKTETMHAVKCIKNLCEQADTLDLAADAVIKARAGMQEKVRQRARKTVRGSILFHADIHEVELIEDAFSDLSKYPGLKPVDKWRGHRSGFFLTTQKGLECRLRHSKNELVDAITQVPPVLERKAVDNFHSLLGWMSDRPMPDCQRLGYAQDIVDTAKKDQALADESYVQLLKQLTDNPSKRSELEGWKLMLQMCQQVRPGKQLDDFVHAFLLKASRDQEGDEVSMMARQCVADLNIITSPETVREDAEELMTLQVHLIDHTSRKVHVPKGSTLEQLAERMASQLRISNAKDFCFFQMTQDLELHRLLPLSTPVSLLLQKFETLRKATGRTTGLLYKRKLLQVMECLQPGDLMHATLTFRQAVWDYLHYPIPEDPSFVVDIAANLLQFEYDYFEKYVDDNKIHADGVLSKLVPEVSLRHEQNRNKWAQEIIAKFHFMDWQDETRLMQMSRIFTMLQRMKLFGTYYWMGRQQMSVPKERISIVDAPEQMIKLNQKAPEAEYWICVDLFGLRFVAADSTPGKGFQRGFLFNDEAVERLLCWGAKDDYAEFVVMTINPALPEAGRVPMTLAVKSPAAMDISFAIHTVLTHLGMLPQ
mmetsp:Transcript_81463/g.197413  ORF Transcript_81463/g.197413 Transcript_81463/m.197413 type:complete len:1062 (+) Transcript_81463:127-3312(+)